MPEPAETGRSAWTSRGNKLAKRMYLKGCSWGLSDVTDQDRWAVNRAVLAIQNLLGVDYASSPGIFGPRTDAAVRAFQTANVPPADGIVGPNTSRALLRPLVAQKEKENGIPGRLLWGIIGAESGWDMGAVGAMTPDDLGVVQINMNWQTFPEDNAMDPRFAVEWGARRLKATANNLAAKGCPPDRLWDAAVLSHNSPVNGRKYAATGTYPTQQAADYVARVRKAAATP